MDGHICYIRRKLKRPVLHLRRHFLGNGIYLRDFQGGKTEHERVVFYTTLEATDCSSLTILSPFTKSTRQKFWQFRIE